MTDTFLGFPRARGPAGVRSHVLVIPTVVCSAHVAQQVAARAPGAIATPHQHGCSQIGRDRDQTFSTLAGTGANPNVYGVVVVGLGCEAVPSGELAEAIAAWGKPVVAFDIQDVGGTTNAIALGCERASELVRQAASEERRQCPVSDLILATECGGSDGWSGVTGNPVIGRAADRMVEAGGTVILAETTELIGAEHLLAARACTAEVGEQVIRAVCAMEERVIAYGADIRGGNPTPGNLEGGISSLEEKSLGCVHKGGTTPVQEVIGYGERPSRRGLVVMDTPGQDIEQISGMLAGGAQIVVFSTGRGSPVGSAGAPVIKVSTNTPLFERMREDMDLDAGVVLSEGRTVQEVGDALFQEVLLVASGKVTSSERLGHVEFAINRIGPTV